MTDEIRIGSLRAFVYRAPVATPVVTSFGTMFDRPAVLVRVEDTDGAVGWGEIWCNYPSVGAEHRARLVDRLFARLLEGQVVAGPPEAFARLTERTAVMALQCGEPGPFAQCIAGIDIALWDLLARRSGQALWRMLGGSSPEIAVYASGLNPDGATEMAVARHAEGYRAFKLKVGFGRDRDVGNLRELRGALGGGVALMADANQGWTVDEALEAAPMLEEFALGWLEEPLRADVPWTEWMTLRTRLAVPLAAGENIAGETEFAAATASGALAVIQPDVAKWGGITGNLPVAREILDRGLAYCPHWLGGGIGLLASAHLLAAAGGTGSLEVDANPNPLRSLTCGTLRIVREGRARLSETPGLGEPPDIAALASYLVPH